MPSLRTMHVGRGVAQPGSALDWGSRGRWFKSSRPDQFHRQSRADSCICSLVFWGWEECMPGVILVTNDDGIHAAGLQALAAALEDLGEVYVVAPDREQSAVGHALTLHRPLRVDQLAERRFAGQRTPSYCVNLGVLGLLPEAPVLVASGINHGANLGDDVTYSGTVSAAMEGTLLGVASMAVSRVDPDGSGFARAAGEARAAAARLLVEGLPAPTLLNVNVPPRTL